MLSEISDNKDKSTAEGSVNLFTTQIIARLRNYQFFTMEEYNKQALIEMDKINQKPFQKKQGSRYSTFIEFEKDLLLPLPARPFVMFTRKVAKVQNNSHVYYQKYYYSVPYSYIGQEVEMKIFNDYLEIYQNLELLATHPTMKNNTASRYSTDISHLPPDAGKYGDWNKNRYLNWAKTKGPYTHQVIKRIFDSKEVEHQCYRTVHSILKLADSFSDQRLETSCQLVLDRHSVPSYKYIKSILMNNQGLEERTVSQTEKGSRFVRGGSYFGKR